MTADVAGRDVGAVAGEIDGLIEQVEFPLEHHAELLGGFQEQQADRTRLIGVAVAAVIAIFLLLQAALRELAAGDPVVLHPPARPCGRRGGGAARRWDADARLDRRAAGSLGHRRPGVWSC